MRGICGPTCATDQRVRLRRAAMAYRGLDDEGIVSEQRPGIAAVARRLSIIELHEGHRPLSNEDSWGWVALNESCNAARGNYHSVWSLLALAVWAEPFDGEA